MWETVGGRVQRGVGYVIGMGAVGECGCVKGYGEGVWECFRIW